MTIIVAVTDTPEGAHALTAAAEEARRFGTDLVAVNLGLSALTVPPDPSITISIVERAGRGDRDPVDTVLHEIAAHETTRLVIGIKRRSAVSKAVLGSVSQRLLLQAPVPVLTVKSD